MATWYYKVTAMEAPVVFNASGDNDPNGRLFVLNQHKKSIQQIRQDFLNCRKFLAYGTRPGSGSWPYGVIPTLKKLEGMSYNDFMATYPLFKPYPELIRTIQNGLKRVHEWDKQPGKRASFIISYHHLETLIKAECTNAQKSDWWNAIMPHDLIRPLVLRANVGDTVEVELDNELEVPVGLHLQADGYDVHASDGAIVGSNGRSFAAPRGSRHFKWKVNQEGVYTINDMCNLSGGENGTNVHGLFGALVVEPKGAKWRDAQTGTVFDTNDQYSGAVYADMILGDAPQVHEWNFEKNAYVGQEFDDIPAESSFREYVVFFHDEMEGKSIFGHDDHAHLGADKAVAPLEDVEQEAISEVLGEKGAALMGISLRSEPLHNRVPHALIDKAVACDGNGQEINTYIKPFLHYYHKSLGFELTERDGNDKIPVGPGHQAASEADIARKWYFKVDNEIINGEEQHHSSWMFGDPATPIMRAYRGDPARIRLVHGGVKETHVFHLHVHQWRAILGNKDTQLLDSITIGPQGAMTIEPLYGAGSRQHTPGDVIWHCHLYPHFHHGMWALWRVHDKLEDGARKYPDGTRIAPLEPLPGNQPTTASPQKPGWPLYIPCKAGHKSPAPPGNPRRLLTLDQNGNSLGLAPTQLENDSMIPAAQRQAGEWFTPIGDRKLADKTFDIVVVNTRVDYNSKPWYDKNGHFYMLRSEYNKHKDAIEAGTYKEAKPLFIRANKGEIIHLKLENLLDDTSGDPYNTGQINVDCALHVHLVKFDVVAGDGGSSGWNYLSGAMTKHNQLKIAGTHEYRWYADEEFGVVFFHDHLLADYRQKRGLFAALIIEPTGAEYLDPSNLNKKIEFGDKAVIKFKNENQTVQYVREFCLGLGDQIPLFAHDEDEHTGHMHQEIPLNAPGVDSMEDPGCMGVNYRSAPLELRDKERFNPFTWFSSNVYSDPETPIWEAYPNDQIYLRMVQGSHEEQHSFMMHGFRWRHFWKDAKSPWRNQQTIGISEAFTLVLDTKEQVHKSGDYLWQFASIDDLWLGCWGLLRLLGEESSHLPLLPGYNKANFNPAFFKDSPVRSFEVWAKGQVTKYGSNTSDIYDPQGLVYQIVKSSGADLYKDAKESIILKTVVGEPLVIRCKKGEWVRLTLHNKLPAEIHPELAPPRLPLEEGGHDHLDAGGEPGTERLISNRVSIHANLVNYDVNTSDGAFVGKNMDSTVGLGDQKTYLWYASDEGVCYLQDMADIRNHRHHGLIGALIVLPEDATPYDSEGHEKWHGVEAVVKNDEGEPLHHEFVLFFQDGLYLATNESGQEVPIKWGEENESDPEDLGQKAFNYRSPLLFEVDNLNYPTAFPPHKWLLFETELERAKDTGTTVPSLYSTLERTFLHPGIHWKARPGEKVRIHLVGGCDRPRNHMFTLHANMWPEIESANNVASIPQTGSVNGVSTGFVRTIEFSQEEPGDYLFRTGVLKWALAQGLWGILSIEGSNNNGSDSTSSYSVEDSEKS